MNDRIHTGRQLARRTVTEPLSRLRARLVDGDPMGEFIERRRERRLAPAERLPPRPPEALRLLTLNIAHGRRRVPHQALVPSQRVRQTLDEVGTLITRLDAEVVALQEADGPSVWSGNFDHVAALVDASPLQWHFRGDHNPFGVGRHNVKSGTALLTRWPLDAPKSHRFASSWRCTKGFVAARLTVPRFDGLGIDLVSVHLDFLRPEVRKRQIHAMSEALADRDDGRPLVVLGDLNCCFRHERESLDLLMRRLGLHTFEPEELSATYPAYRPRRRLDWIFASRELRFVAHHLVPVKLSDHLGVVADLAPAG